MIFRSKRAIGKVSRSRSSKRYVSNSGKYDWLKHLSFKTLKLGSIAGAIGLVIVSIVWAHIILKVAAAIQPRALCITQGRAVGVAHYLLGGIATTWSFFLARIIAVG